jgi:hypothetical protein
LPAERRGPEEYCAQTAIEKELPATKKKKKERRTTPNNNAFEPATRVTQKIDTHRKGRKEERRSEEAEQGRDKRPVVVASDKSRISQPNSHRKDYQQRQEEQKSNTQNQDEERNSATVMPFLDRPPK